MKKIDWIMVGFGLLSLAGIAWIVCMLMQGDPAYASATMGVIIS